MGLKPWDIAAGVLLIQEAGGLVGHFDGTLGIPETAIFWLAGRKSLRRWRKNSNP